MAVGKMTVDELSTTAESLSDLSERVLFLSEAARVLASSIDYKETFECLSCLIVPRLADWVTINRVLPDGSIERVAHRHADPVFDQRLHGMNLPPPPRNARVGISQVLSSHNPILVAEHAMEYLDLLESAGWGPDLIRVLREMKVVSAMGVPMIKGKDQVIGGLAFFTSELSGRHYCEADLRMAQELGNLAAMAIHNAILHRDAVDEVQKMRVLSSMREEFIRKQIHDIRTPLTALGMLIEIISRSSANPERIQELVEKARENIHRTSKMLGNLSPTSSPEAAKEGTSFGKGAA